jgi:dTDP-4-dehydrorhamnose reductase
MEFQNRANLQFALEVRSISDRIRRLFFRIFTEAWRPRVEKLLIVGIDTPVGSNLALTLADRCEITGICCRSEFEVPECRTLPIRLAPSEYVFESIVAERPAWIIYCGPTALSSWDWKEEPHFSQEPKQIAIVDRASKQCGSHLMLISTDAVFHGPRLFHRECFPKAIDQPAAIAAIEAEKAITAEGALILRTHTFGWSPKRESYAEQLWDSVTHERAVAPSGTRYATPILTTDLAELLWRAHRRQLSGIFHAGGAERASMWQFATLMAAACGTNLKMLHLAVDDRGQDLAMRGHARCGQETSLDSRKLQRAVELQLPLLREGMTQFVEQAHNGHRDRLTTAMILPGTGTAAA